MESAINSNNENYGLTPYDLTPLKSTALFAYEDYADYTPSSQYPWSDIIEEIEERKAKGQKANLLSESEKERDLYKNKLPEKTKLGDKYGNTYFTRREAECMVWLLKGKTIDGIAKILKLSPRTIEYYLKHMKIKVGCRTKFELIDLIHSSDFPKNVDFYKKYS